MAQINVIGYVTQDIVLKQSQEGNAYVHFFLKEYLSKSRYQTYQVWIWENIIPKLKRNQERQSHMDHRLLGVSGLYRKGSTGYAPNVENLLQRFGCHSS